MRGRLGVQLGLFSNRAGAFGAVIPYRLSSDHITPEGVWYGGGAADCTSRPVRRDATRRFDCLVPQCDEPPEP